MRQLLTIHLGVLFLLLTACTPSASLSDRLMQADSLMQVYPDSALHILQEISSHRLNTPAERAYYALLLTQAYDKNYVKQFDDSLIRIAVHYYDSVADKSMQARAHYYAGSVYRDMNEAGKAIKNFLFTIPLAQKEKNLDLLGLTYNNIGYLYYIQDLNEKADSIYQLVENIAIQQNDSIFLAEVLVRQSKINLKRGEEYYPKAEQLMLYALDVAINSSDRMKEFIYQSLSTLYSRSQNGVEALKYAKLAVSLQQDTTYYKNYLLLGDAYYKAECYDSATVYLNKSLLSEEFYIKAGAYMRLADIATEQERYKEAVELERMYSVYKDSVQQERQDNDIISAESLYLLQQQKDYRTIPHRWFFLLTIIPIGAILFLFLYRYYRRKNSNYQKPLFAQRAVGVSQTLSKNEKKMRKQLYEESEIYRKMKGIIKEYKKTSSSEEKFDENDWKELIAETNKRWEDITTRLKNDFNLSQDEICICCYLLTDFPTASLEIFIDRTRSTIYRKREAIIQKTNFKQENSSFVEALIKYGENESVLSIKES